MCALMRRQSSPPAGNILAVAYLHRALYDDVRGVDIH